MVTQKKPDLSVRISLHRLQAGADVVFKMMFEVRKPPGGLPLVILEASVPVEAQKYPNLKCCKTLASYFLRDCDATAVGGGLKGS